MFGASHPRAVIKLMKKKREMDLVKPKAIKAEGYETYGSISVETLEDFSAGVEKLYKNFKSTCATPDCDFKYTDERII